MVEKPILDELMSLGWQYINSEEARRKRGNDEVLLLDELRKERLRHSCLDMIYGG